MSAIDVLHAMKLNSEIIQREGIIKKRKPSDPITPGGILAVEFIDHLFVSPFNLVRVVKREVAAIF